MLSDIAAIALHGPDDLYVLDADYRKIAVFDSAGNLRRVILGGSGEGPGEFHNPGSLSVALDGRIFVLDESQRVSVFSPEGEFMRSFLPSDGPFKTVVIGADGRLWLGRRIASSNYAAVVYDTLGRPGDQAFPVNPNCGHSWVKPRPGRFG
ncbi:MAG: 6-bladed beta-propeller [Longimicrobiales bacterium]